MTRRWRTGAGRRGTGTTAALPLTAVLTVLLTALLPTSPVAADGGSGYAFAPDARTIAAATDTAAAAPLEPGRTYRSTLPEKGELYFAARSSGSSAVTRATANW
ncbi:hypothetical protein AB0D38_25340 [Streptomyces sp. NPDC048279]|uniref:hypothetical protein n=1 Tax=Streptomyces sp. NPDC048279 TaxID=3154714 RepID=UPI003415D7F3